MSSAYAPARSRHTTCRAGYTPQHEDSAPVLVVGGTGRQGGAVARTLLKSGINIRCFARNDHRNTQDLRSLGAQIAYGDLNDPVSVGLAFEGARAAFVALTFDGPEGVEGEVRQGQTVVEAPSAASVEQVTYSSVGAADLALSVPQLSSKARKRTR